MPTFHIGDIVTPKTDRPPFYKGTPYFVTNVNRGIDGAIDFDEIFLSDTGQWMCEFDLEYHVEFLKRKSMEEKKTDNMTPYKIGDQEPRFYVEHADKHHYICDRNYPGLLAGNDILLHTCSENIANIVCDILNTKTVLVSK